MSRIQLALDVDDLDASVAFYRRLLGTEPAKRRPGYASFAVAEPPLKLVLLENPGRGGGVNHLGIEVSTRDEVGTEAARLAGAGLATDEQRGTTCCYATQDKVWVTGPDGERWEVYTVLADSPVPSDSSVLADSQEPGVPPPPPVAADDEAPAARAAACC